VRTVTPEELPADWTEEPPPPSTQALGDQWVRTASSAVLELPSTIVRIEPNYLFNPAHPDFKKVRIGKAMPFAFDPRLR
jgi:RES domain-containing protein